jgi:hypothetical protein
MTLSRYPQKLFFYFGSLDILLLNYLSRMLRTWPLLANELLNKLY